MLIGPTVDLYFSQAWVFSYAFTMQSGSCLAVSCLLAVLVNLSQFLCLGQISAVSYQVFCVYICHK